MEEIKRKKDQLIFCWNIACTVAIKQIRDLFSLSISVLIWEKAAWLYEFFCCVIIFQKRSITAEWTGRFSEINLQWSDIFPSSFKQDFSFYFPSPPFSFIIIKLLHLLFWAIAYEYYILPPSLSVCPCCHQLGACVLTALFSSSSLLVFCPGRYIGLLVASKSVSGSRWGFLAALIPPTAPGQLLFGSGRRGGGTSQLIGFLQHREAG